MKQLAEEQEHSFHEYFDDESRTTVGGVFFCLASCFAFHDYNCDDVITILFRRQTS